MARKNNKADMTATEIIQNVKEKMCDDYCIYRSMAFSQHKDVDEAEEYLSRYCEECPLNEL